MLGWLASLCLNLLVTNVDSSKGATTKIKGKKESRGAKDVIEDGLILDYSRRKD